MKYRIITISRQSGSGGRNIARSLAEELGIPCYDQELIEKFAEKSGYAKEYVAKHSEYAAHDNWLSNALTLRDYSGHSVQDYLYDAQKEVILDLAEKEPCIIIGRCADYILRERKDVLNVFIHASRENRIARIKELFNYNDAQAEKRVSDKDKRRKIYYEYYTDQTWGDANNYHISLNAGNLDFADCARIIKAVYKAEE